jgi:hypothetical protein
MLNVVGLDRRRDLVKLQAACPYINGPATSLQVREISLANILIQKSQLDAHVTEFISSDDCSTCFGYHYHPSSGAQNN